MGRTVGGGLTRDCPLNELCGDGPLTGGSPTSSRVGGGGGRGMLDEAGPGP